MKQIELVNSATTQIKSDALTSSKYHLIPTTKLVESFNEKGWYVSSQSEARTKRVEKRGYQKHILRFRNDTVKPLIINGTENYIELVVINSHDGLNALRVMLGIYRVVCSNGLIVGSQFLDLRVKHDKYWVSHLDNAINSLFDSIPRVVEVINRMASINLTRDEAMEFMKKAANTRLKGIKDIVNVTGLDTVQREEDKGSDLYTILNVAQEKLVRGGIKYTTSKVDD